MPDIHSDDGTRQIRLVFLGPKGLTLPFEWTYMQWGVCVGLGSALAWLLNKITEPLGFWYGILYGFYGLIIGVIAGVLLMKRVSFDEPLHYKALTLWRLFVTERGTKVPAPVQRFDIEWPPLTQLHLPTTPKEPHVIPAKPENEDEDDYAAVCSKARRAI